ncbi:DMT family transporter [Segnochrobactrum spirostomi]|uniref:DMT family transporter n=1 Tax=Segnochrobactrum spirostomi TaxID=2608987 RepID=A0A6A7Y2K7_9HYPH|nr:DMT family transporter [Segnochrobactrum spirostomi]MQT13283.1 DMT family transporter [Segnochrobactrum spirostomi]
MTASTPGTKSMSAGAWGMLLVLSVLWGGSFFFNGVAVRELPTFTVVVSRVVIAAAILWSVLLLSGQPAPRGRAVWAAFFGMGILNNVIPFSLIVWAQGHIPSGVASILNATTPLFGVVVAHVLTADEKLTPPRLFGVLAGLVGVAVMMGSAALGRIGTDTVADLACLGAALSYAFAGVFGRRFRRMGVAPIAAATGQVTASSLVLMPVMLLVDQPWSEPWPSAAAIGAILGLAALSTALGYILFFRVLAAAGAINIMLVTLLVPVSAILLGVVVLGEAILPRHLAGMALIALGLAAIDGRPWRALRDRFSALRTP